MSKRTSGDGDTDKSVFREEGHDHDCGVVAHGLSMCFRRIQQSCCPYKILLLERSLPLDSIEK